MTSTAPDGRELVHPKSRAEWRSWLERHHGRPDGVWFVAFKKATGKPRVEYDDAVEEALAFGWIDSKANTLDDERSLMWMSPRKPKSGWSKLNKGRIARLERDGLMAPAGSAVVAAAKRSGAWTLLDAVEALEIPDDLRKALSRNRTASEFFEAFPPSAKKAILTWIASAKRDATREKRIAETVRLAAENKRANQ